MSGQSKTERIGLIGVGLMGHGIAANLLRAGWPLGFLDHPGNQPTSDLTAGGAVACGTARDLAAASDRIVLCVTGAPQVEAVIFSEDGLLAGLRAGTTVIDCSTSLPETTRRIAEAVAAKGGRFLDAPMTRTPKEAAEGRLNLIVGGDPDLFAEMRPMLGAFAESIAHVGPVGAGHAMKLIHNYVSLGFAAIVAEAAACAHKAGIPADSFLSVLAAGGGGGVALERMRPFLESGDPEALRFTLANAAKDMGYFREMTAQAGLTSATATAIHALFEAPVQDGQGECFVPELIDRLKR